MALSCTECGGHGESALRVKHKRGCSEFGYNRKVSTTIYLEREQMDALHRMSAATDTAMAALIRRGVDAVLLEGGEDDT